MIDKGVTGNYTTRTGEGMHSEVRQAYAQTNFKNVDEQVRLYYLGIVSH
jgi:hypothetical protein